MSFVVDLFSPGILDFIKLARNPTNKADFNRAFTRALQQFANFNRLTKGFSGLSNLLVDPKSRTTIQINRQRARNQRGDDPEPIFIFDDEPIPVQPIVRPDDPIRISQKPPTFAPKAPGFRPPGQDPGFIPPGQNAIPPGFEKGNNPGLGIGKGKGKRPVFGGPGGGGSSNRNEGRTTNPPPSGNGDQARF